MEDETTLEQSLNQFDETVTEQQEEIEERVVETPQQKNFKALRDEKDRLKRERDEFERRLLEAEKAKLQRQSERDPDDLVEARYVNDRIAQLEQKLQMQHIETRLKYEHPDIEDVVTADNLQQLARMKPQLSAVINSSPDVYNKAKAAYDAIKSLNIIPDQETSLNQSRIEKNMNKPRASNSVSPTSDSALTKASAFAGELSNEMKDLHWKEMRRILNQG